MTREFVELGTFLANWQRLGLDDDDLKDLQQLLLEDPDAGDIMKNTGGVRKVRVPQENRAKNRSVRVCYTDFEEYELIYLLVAFGKKDKDNLSDDEKKAVKKLVKALLSELRKEREK